MYSFGFIGCGNMGGTLARKVAEQTANVAVADRDPDAARRIAEATGAVVSSNGEIASSARYVVLGVKPQVLPRVLEEIAPALSARKDAYTLISMAAGVRTEKIASILGFPCGILRIMPNTPAGVGQGMIVFAGNDRVTEEERNDFLLAFAPAGKILPVAEDLIDACSAVSGCGPAFVYMFIEALADGGVRCGLPRAMAMELAAQTVLGSAKTVLESGKHPGALKDAVCSPGGSTIEGVQTLESGAFRGTVSEAVRAAFERTVELG